MLPLIFFFIFPVYQGILAETSYWNWPTPQDENHSFINMPMIQNIGKRFTYTLRNNDLVIGIYEECSNGKDIMIVIRLYFPRKNPHEEKPMEFTITQKGFILKNSSGIGNEERTDQRGFNAISYQYSAYKNVEVTLESRKIQGLNIIITQSSNFSNHESDRIFLYLICACSGLIAISFWAKSLSRDDEKFVFQPCDFFYLQMYIIAEIFCANFTKNLIVITTVIVIICKFFDQPAQKFHLELLIPFGFFAIHYYRISFETIGFFVILAHLQQLTKYMKNNPQVKIYQGQKKIPQYTYIAVMYCTVLLLSLYNQNVFLPRISLSGWFYITSILVSILTIVINLKKLRQLSNRQNK